MQGFEDARFIAAAHRNPLAVKHHDGRLSIVLGANFLVLWSFDAIPGVFALPAGIGDTLVGLMALPAAFYLASGAVRGRAVAGR